MLSPFEEASATQQAYVYHVRLHLRILWNCGLHCLYCFTAAKVFGS